MRQCCNIGKDVIYQAVGVADNYKVSKDSTCNACKHFGTRLCQSCPHYSKSDIVYVNELNKYGSKPSLPMYSLKLLIYTYFQNIFEGRYCWINTLEAANMLGCCEKSIWQSLERLSTGTYLHFEKKSSHMALVDIFEYEKMYLHADKGGRGYYTITLPIFEKLINIKNILTMRVVLRELVNLSSLDKKGYYSGNYINMKDVQRYLPRYCKPCVIRFELSNCSNNLMEFEFIKKDKKNIIHLNIDYAYRAASSRDSLKAQFEREFKDFAKEFDSNIYGFHSHFDAKSVDFFKRVFEPNGVHIEDVRFVRFMNLNDDILDDLSEMALEYGFETVKQGLCAFYVTYIWTHNEKEAKEPGAIIRTIIRHRILV